MTELHRQLADVLNTIPKLRDSIPDYPADYQVTEVKVMRDLDKRILLNNLERDVLHFQDSWLGIAERDAGGPL